MAVCIAAVFAIFGGYSFATANASTPSTATLQATVLSMLNASRTAHGLPALQSNPDLVAAAYGHNLVQKRYNVVSHQIAAEPVLVHRIHNAGYNASYDGENLGATSMSLTGLTNLQNAIFASTVGRAPILSTAYTQVGISVLLDTTHNKLWLTEDYARPTSLLTPVPSLSTAASTLLSMLNTERGVNHRAPLSMNAALIRSAHAHNLAMAAANTMSHQLPHEPVFTDRIEHAGYNWGTAGENIGWNSDVTVNGAKALETIMYNEVAPNNGHRLNILSTSFRNVGIDVYYDLAHGKIWLTEDFASPL
jgi:uncharacterized protein YkwD